jgi:hypothetical protein
LLYLILSSRNTWWQILSLGCPYLVHDRFQKILGWETTDFIPWSSLA